MINIAFKHLFLSVVFILASLFALVPKEMQAWLRFHEVTTQTMSADPMVTGEALIWASMLKITRESPQKEYLPKDHHLEAVSSFLVLRLVLGDRGRALTHCLNTDNRHFPLHTSVPLITARAQRCHEPSSITSCYKDIICLQLHS